MDTHWKRRIEEKELKGIEIKTIRWCNNVVILLLICGLFSPLFVLIVPILINEVIYVRFLLLYFILMFLVPSIFIFSISLYLDHIWELYLGN